MNLEETMSHLTDDFNFQGNQLDISNDLLSLQYIGYTERDLPSRRIFDGKKVYYSGSIAGVAEKEPDFAEHLVRYMTENGATILSEHVAIPHKKEEFKLVLATKLGLSLEEFIQLDQDELSRRIYENDMLMVNNATHFIALVNAPSHGVGMEIQRALDKPKMGLNPTPILCLIHEDAKLRLSAMIRGVAETNKYFLLKTYSTFIGAEQAVYEFLTNSPYSLL